MVKLDKPKSSHYLSLLESPLDRHQILDHGYQSGLSIFHRNADDLGPTHRTRSTRFGFHTSQVNTLTVFRSP